MFVPGRQSKEPAPIRATLVATNGPYAGTRYPLTMEQGIGLEYCGPAAIVAPQSLGIGRLHCTITFVDGRFAVVANIHVSNPDSNPTFCNADRLTPDARSHALAHGDILRCGQAEYRFEVDDITT